MCDWRINLLTFPSPQSDAMSANGESGLIVRTVLGRDGGSGSRRTEYLSPTVPNSQIQSLVAETSVVFDSPENTDSIPCS